MLGGSAAKKLDNESQNQVGNSLAADKAKRRGKLRVVDDFEPYPEEPADDNIPEEGGEEQNTMDEQQAQLEAEEQSEENENMETKLVLIDAKQTANAKRKDRSKATSTLAQATIDDVIKTLNKFKSSMLSKLLSFFVPKIYFLIYNLNRKIQKGNKKLKDKAKIIYLNSLLLTITNLISVIGAVKFRIAFFDAAFIDGFSCLRLVISTCATCVIPFILILVSPIYIPFLAILFIIGKFPMLKGTLTKELSNLTEYLKKLKEPLQKMLKIIEERIKKGNRNR